MRWQGGGRSVRSPCLDVERVLVLGSGEAVGEALANAFAVEADDDDLVTDLRRGEAALDLCADRGVAINGVARQLGFGARVEVNGADIDDAIGFAIAGLLDADGDALLRLDELADEAAVGRGQQ